MNQAIDPRPRDADEPLRLVLGARLGLPEDHALVQALARLVGELAPDVVGDSEARQWLTRLVDLKKHLPSHWDGMVLLEIRAGRVHKMRPFGPQPLYKDTPWEL